MLLNANVMIYFKVKLQLKFRNNSYSSTVVNFQAGLPPGNNINLILKLINRKSESCHEKRTSHRYIATPVLLKPLKQRFIDVTSFRLSKSLYSRPVLFKCTNNSGSVFPNRLDRRIYETEFPTHASPPPNPNFFHLIPFNESLSFSTVHMVMVFWVVTPYSRAGGYQHFGGTCSLHLQD